MGAAQEMAKKQKGKKKKKKKETFSVNLLICKTFVPTTFPLLQKLLASPLPSSEQFLWATWDAISWA